MWVSATCSAFAAVFLGATSITPGRFNAWGTVIAVYTLAAGIAGLQQFGAPFFIEQFFNGAALLLAIAANGQGAIPRNYRRHIKLGEEHGRDKKAEIMKRETSPLYNDRKMKLATFCTNLSGGCAITTIDGVLEADWPSTLSLAKLGDAMEFEALVPVGRWQGSAAKRISMVRDLKLFRGQQVSAP